MSQKLSLIVISGCPRIGKTTIAKRIASTTSGTHLIHGDAIMAAIRATGSLPARVPPEQWENLNLAWEATVTRDTIVTRAMSAAVTELLRHTGYEAIITEGAYVPGMATAMLAGIATTSEVALVNTDEDIDREVARLRALNESDPGSWLRKYEDQGMERYVRMTAHRNRMLKEMALDAGVPVVDLSDYAGDNVAFEEAVRRLLPIPL